MTNTQRTIILIDGGNLNKSLEALEGENSRLNYEKLIKDVQRGRQLAQLRYYLEGKKIHGGFVKAIRNEFFGVCVSTGKTSDIQITVDAMTMLHNVDFDTLILMTGDGDFLPLVEALKAHKKRVEIVSFQHSTSKDLKFGGDTWYDIQHQYFINQKPKDTDGSDQ